MQPNLATPEQAPHKYPTSTFSGRGLMVNPNLEPYEKEIVLVVQVVFFSYEDIRDERTGF